jgi:hypothetical protein
MANTMTKIATLIPSGSVTQVVFTSIPQIYTDLVLKVSARSAATTTSALLTVFNNDTSTTNSTTRLIGNGSTASSDRFTAQSYGSVYNNAMNISTYTANVYSNSEMYIPNYANTTNYKTYIIDGVSESNIATGPNQNFLAGLWRNTSAITQINVLDANGTNLTSFSTFTLYGINNS